MSEANAESLRRALAWALLAVVPVDVVLAVLVERGDLADLGVLGDGWHEYRRPPTSRIGFVMTARMQRAVALLIAVVTGAAIHAAIALRGER